MSDCSWQRMMAYNEGYEQGRYDAMAKWISCSERLPEFRYENVLVWYEYFNYDFNSMCRTYGIGYCSLDGTWHGDVSGTKAKCLAWMPLPDAYEEDE